nr:hypothetical protein [Tanacetum cinerariifolium]
MPSKPNLVFNTAPTTVETDHYAFNVQLSLTKPDQELSHTNRPKTPIIKDWVSDSKDESKTKEPQIVPSFVQSTEQIKSPRHSDQHVETSIPAATPKPASRKPTSNDKRRNRKACFHMVPAAVLTQSKPVSITAVRPVSADVPKLKVTRPRHAKPIVTKRKMRMETKMPNSRPCFLQHKCINDPKKGNPQHALKDKGVIDSGCSRHMTGNMSYLSDFEELNGGYVSFGGKVDEGFLVGYSVNSKAFRVFNSRTRIIQETLHVNFMENKPNVTDAAFDGKEPEFDEKKPESEVNVSPSSRYKDLSAEFEDYSKNNINEVNAAGTLVSTVGQISPNSTNTFSDDGPSNAATSPTYGKSSFIDASQLPDDPDMP